MGTTQEERAKPQRDAQVRPLGPGQQRRGCEENSPGSGQRQRREPGCGVHPTTPLRLPQRHTHHGCPAVDLTVSLNQVVAAPSHDGVHHHTTRATTHIRCTCRRRHSCHWYVGQLPLTLGEPGAGQHLLGLSQRWSHKRHGYIGGSAWSPKQAAGQVGGKAQRKGPAWPSTTNVNKDQHVDWLGASGGDAWGAATWASVSRYPLGSSCDVVHGTGSQRRQRGQQHL